MYQRYEIYVFFIAKFETEVQKTKKQNEFITNFTITEQFVFLFTRKFSRPFYGKYYRLRKFGATAALVTEKFVSPP